MYTIVYYRVGVDTYILYGQIGQWIDNLFAPHVSTKFDAF